MISFNDRSRETSVQLKGPSIPEKSKCVVISPSAAANLEIQMNKRTPTFSRPLIDTHEHGFGLLNVSVSTGEIEDALETSWNC